MQADLRLKQAFWETPRNITVLIGVAIGIAGVLGFKLGQNTPPQQPIIIQLAPSVMVAPPAPAK